MQRKTHNKKRAWHGVKNSTIASSSRVAVKLSVVANSVREAMRDGSLRNRSVLAGALVLLPVAVQAFPAQFNLADLNGSNGFVLNGVDGGDQSGRSVSGVGDINGDGVADLIIGASSADPNGNNRVGVSYVVFGGSGVGSTGAINLSGLNGSNGFALNGVDNFDRSGYSVSGAGDINGDGVDDLIIGAFYANSRSGESYVVFGGSGVGSTGAINLSGLSGTDGFVLNGLSVFDYSGKSVSGAGDINGDGVDDLIIGAYNAYPNGDFSAGESYVVFGGSGVGSTGEINLSGLTGSDGFVLNGVDAGDLSGRSVSGAGDINGDGVDDLIIGADNADPNGNSFAGESYVVFGDSGIGSTGEINLSGLSGSDGFVLNGVDAGDLSGGSVSGAGDINGDGVDDLIIGADYADPNGNDRAGESYVVFGGSGVGSTGAINLSGLNGSNGFVLNGVDAEDRSGISVSGAGDINGDGVADLIIGAFSADPNGLSRAGESYVVFGGSGVGSTGAINLSGLSGSDGFVLNGVVGRDYSGISVSGAGDINDDGVDDMIIGAVSADPNFLTGAGESYVVFGQSDALPTGSLCNGLVVTVDLNFGETPGPGDDVVLGTPGADDIRGRAGNDTICGMGGNDFIHGNSGDDWIDGGDGVDNIRGGQGDDILFSGSGATVGTSSRVFGGTGDDSIFGGPDADDLRGGRGDDMISGEQGADSITGNDDDDLLFGGPGADTLKGGNGENDELFGEGGADSLNGGSGSNDFCDGGGQGGDTDTNCEVI